MQKINPAILEYPTLRLQQILSSHLQMVWHNVGLTGPFWRLYYNDLPGAWLEADGRRIELQVDKLYLLIPNCNVRAGVAGNPLQVFIHFELSGVGGVAKYPWFELDTTENCRRKMNELRHLLSCAGEEDTTVRRELLSYSLIGYALSEVPPDGFTALDYDARVAAACRYLRRHFAEPIDLAELGRQSGMAPNAFLRLFNLVTGTPPHQYLLNQRYVAAAQLLGQPEYSIKEVCEQIGVPDRFHFSRTFKKIYGLPPAQYRQKLWQKP